ncbi:MAG: hypothetical protein Q8880_05330 [Bacteroidota bacterium]|nr:hypothetical protein [Bacteroidota bacterium]
MKLFLSLILIFLSVLSFSQNKKLYIQNNVKPKKIREISPEKDIEITYLKAYDYNKWMSITLGGKIKSFSDSSVMITLKYYNENTSTSKTSVEFTDKMVTVVEVEFNKILSFSFYSPKTQKFIGTISTILITTGAAAAIGAPLASIRYNNGTINEKTYYPIVLSGLASISAGIISIFGIPATSSFFYISNKSDKKYWHFMIK